MMTPWILRLRWPLIDIKMRMEKLAGKYDQFEGFLPLPDGYLRQAYDYRYVNKFYQWDGLWGRWIDVTKKYEARIISP